MKFALNYSPQASELIANHEIDIDLYKCPSWEDLAKTAQAQRPIYVHFSHITTPKRMDAIDFETVHAWLNRTETKYVNIHIVPETTAFSTEAPSDEQVLEMVCGHVEKLCAAFGSENVIVENVPFPDLLNVNLMPLGVTPSFIAQVVSETQCKLLLDVAHAKLTCDHFGWDVYEYLNNLPVHRLAELHVTGIGLNRDGIPEDHLPMREVDFELIGWVIEQIKENDTWSTPDIMACEYGGVGPLFEWRSDIDVLRADIPRLSALARSV